MSSAARQIPAEFEAAPVSRAPGGAMGLRMTLLLAFTDFCALTLAISAGFAIWSVVNPLIPPPRPILLLVPLCCMAEFAWSGQYPGIGSTAVDHLRRLWRGITFVYLLLTASMFLTRDLVADSRGALSLGWALSLAIVPGGRWLASNWFQKRSWWGAPVIILGAGEAARLVIRNLKANQILGYRPVACLDDDRDRPDYCEGVPVVGSFLQAGRAAARYGAQYAIVALNAMEDGEFARHLRRWRQVFPRVLLVPNGAATASLWAESRDLGGLLALEMRHNLLNRWNQRIKRAVDVAAAAVGLAISAPLLGVCALWIKRVSPGSAFYTQEREGKDGRLIRVYKLRTMYPDAEALLDRFLEANPAAWEEWDQYCKLKEDPRILPGVGHFLRKTSLDELPQLWNVLKGEMSLVGPRPFPEYHNARFSAEFRHVRTQVMPGLTGLWQISARSNGDIGVQQSLDSYYIRSWSLWLDIYILVRTVRTVIAREGAY